MSVIYAKILGENCSLGSIHFPGVYQELGELSSGAGLFVFPAPALERNKKAVGWSRVILIRVP